MCLNIVHERIYIYVKQTEQLKGKWTREKKQSKKIQVTII